MLKAILQAKRSQRQQEQAGTDVQALVRLQKKVVRYISKYFHFAPKVLFQIDRLSAMDSASEKDTKKFRKAGIGKK